MTTDDTRPLTCFHEDAIDFRTEPATVEIGRCPRCGADTEWRFEASPQPDRHAALVEAARAVVNAWGPSGGPEWDWMNWRILTLRAALDGEPR